MVSVAAKALLLDLDGTLVDSAIAVESAWRWAAEQLGVPFSQIAPFVHGIPADRALELAIPGIDGPTKSRLADAILNRQVESNAAVAAMPGALRLLERMPAGSWAVVTSGSVRLAESSIRKAGLHPIPSRSCAPWAFSMSRRKSAS
jgi:sugar-phosphatase